MGSNVYPGRTFLLGCQGSHALSGAWRTEKINGVSTSLLRAGLVRPRRPSIDQSLGDGADLAAGDRPGAIDLTGTITRRLNHRRNFLSIRSI